MSADITIDEGLVDMAYRCIGNQGIRAEMPIATPYPWKAPKGFPRRRIACVPPHEKHAVSYVSALKFLLYLESNGVSVRPPTPLYLQGNELVAKREEEGSCG